MYVRTYVHVIVVSLFLQCMGYVLREGCTIPCTVKTMRQLSCTDGPYKANTRLASAPECLYYSMYSAPSVWHEVLYTVAILV